MQGLLELSGIPYVGCDIQSSAICMDKSLAYIVARSAGIATPEFWVAHGAEHACARRARVPRLRQAGAFGLVVRRQQGRVRGRAATPPSRPQGSTTRKVLIEQAVVGTEVGCAVLGNGAELIVGEVDQIELLHGFFRIHQEDEPEQGSENAVITVPADICRTRSATQIRETAKAIYAALGCEGLARVDMFLQGGRTGRPQRGQHLARHDVLQPLSPHDGRRRLAASPR